MVHDDFDATLERMVEWANSLNVSKRAAFDRIAELMKADHFGVEAIHVDGLDGIMNDDPPSMEYLNTGDTYSTTLVLTDDYVNGTSLIITSWGDWYEQQERWVHDEYDAIRCAYCGAFQVLEGDDEWHKQKCESCGHHLDGSN